MATVLYGPKASGKTHNSKAIARAYGCKRVLDGWEPGDQRGVRSSDLLITVDRPNDGRHKCIHINDALRKIGRANWIGRDWLAERRAASRNFDHER